MGSTDGAGWLSALALGALLCSCGGSGGGGDGPADGGQVHVDAPVADAGPDAVARVGRPVSLDGSGSQDPDGDSLAYAWSLVSAPAGSKSALSDPRAERPTFVPDLAGRYVFRLTVSDGSGESAPDEVSLQAADNLPPVAVAGAEDTLVGLGSAWPLEAWGTSDPDGDLLTYSWALAGRPAGSGASLARPSSSAPSLTPDVAGDYEVELRVSDGLFWSEPSTVRLKARRFAVGEPLPDLAGGHGTFASAVNTRGQVAGKATVALQGPARTEVHAVVWTQGVPQDLGTFGGSRSEAFDLNESGEAVGVADGPDGLPDGFLWSQGSKTRLGSLGGTWSRPTALNDRGQVVGYAATVGFGSAPFLWEGGVMAPLAKAAKGSVPGEYAQCVPLDVDEAGTAVGYCLDLDLPDRIVAVRWDAEGCAVLTAGYAEAMATQIDGQGRLWGYVVREGKAYLFRFEQGVLSIDEALGPIPHPRGAPGQRGLVAAGPDLVAVSAGSLSGSVRLRSGEAQGWLSLLLEPAAAITSVNGIAGPGGPMVGVYDRDGALPWEVTTTSYVITP